MDYKKLGEVLKEGTINVQDNFEDWVQCRIVIRKRGITLAVPTKQVDPQKKTVVNVVLEFTSPQEFDVVMLPDNARRSRESKMFPFTVQNRTLAAKRSSEGLGTNKGLTSRVLKGMEEWDEVILATSNGREMWEWASCIKWLGTIPIEEKIPLFNEPDCIAKHDKYYEDPQVLQDVLLKMFTYKNLPQKPISFVDIVRTNRELESSVLIANFLYYPDDFFPQSDETDDEFQIDVQSITIENRPQIFGLFAYIVLVGACVHVNEKCFELITSSHLYDMSSQVTWKGNSPFSMLCEGQYNAARKYMFQVLFRLGYPRLEGYSGYACNHSFSRLLAKPSNIWLGVGASTGQPVHPDDQKLCQYLLEKGDGKVANDKLSNKLIKANESNATEFKATYENFTAIVIPKSIMEWGRTTLTKLDVSQNGIFELPDELYSFTALTHLNLSKNCLFGISHKLGNLTQLKYFNIEYNLIEELPHTIENLDKITEFSCNKNPMTKPPNAVWVRGIAYVRKFFRDIRESGIEINVDLRVLVLGLSEAGKTSLINAMINPGEKALTRVGNRTVGIEKRTWVMNRSDNKQPINMLTYDFAGQEEYYITHHLFLGNKALYIIAFDLSKYKQGTLNNQVLLWWDSIQNRVCDVKSNDSITPKVVLVGTHADMIDDAQSRADDIHKSLTSHFKLRMDDLKERINNLEEELGHLDPRKKTEKNEVVCTDITKKAKEEDYDMLSTDKKAQILSQENEIKKLHHAQLCTISLPPTIQAVSSKNLQNMDGLKEQIFSSLTEIGPTGKYFPHLDAPVPRSWFQVRRFVRQQSTQKGHACMKLPNYFKLLSEELDINEDVGRRATKFCHDLGDVLFFEKEDLVFLQPSFLIDVLKYVIRHDHKESTYWTEKMLDRNISEEQFNKGKTLLLQKGELEPWLLEILWLPLYDNFSESSIMNNLIQLLETFDVGTYIEQKGQKILSIPEFQPKKLTKIWPKHKDDSDYEIQRWVYVDQNLPHGLLKRIQVRINKKIFKRSGVKEFDLAQNEIYILDKSLTELYCTTGSTPEEYPGLATSEGLMLYIRGPDKCCVMSLLSKVYSCVENTLHDYPGLVFNHYVVHTIQKVSSFIKLEEAKAIQAAGESKIHIAVQTLDGAIEGKGLLENEEASLNINGK